MNKTITLLFLLLISLAVTAHEGEVHDDEVTNACSIDGGTSGCGYSPDQGAPEGDHLVLYNYTIDFHRPDNLAANTEQHLSITIHSADGSLAEGLDLQGQIVDPATLRDIYYSEVYEEAPGIYAFRWKPSFAGDYYIQYIFRSADDTIIKPTFAIGIRDSRATYAWMIGIVLAVLSVAGGLYSAWPRNKKSFSYKSLLAGLAVAALAIWLAYSVASFYSIGGERGFVVCGDDGCDLAIHWHSQLHMDICGEPFHLPLEAGDLNRVHTHKELDYLHFHSLVKTDETGTTILEPEKLAIGRMFEQLGIPFTDKCFGDYCNGDTCPGGTQGTLTVTVNGVPTDAFADYSYKDGDDITITFG